MARGRMSSRVPKAARCVRMDDGGPKKFFGLAIFAIVASTALLRPQASPAEPAVHECRSKPGSTSRPGTRWYYHVNPTNNQRCWFLQDEGPKVRSRARDSAPTTLSKRPPQHKNPGETA